MKKTKDRLLYISLLFLLTGIFSIYYYGIQVTFFPDWEALDSLIATWGIYLKGGIPGFWRDIIKTICYIFLPLFGLSYKTMRVSYTFLYAIYTIICLDIILRDSKNTLHWYRLPIYVIFMVLLPIRITSSWGQLGNGWIQYPMNQHPESMLCTLVGIWLLYRLLQAEGNKKKGLLILLICWNIFSINMANQIWIIAFLIPEILLLFAKQFGKWKDKWILISIILVAVLYLVLKVLSVKFAFLRNFFAMQGDEVTIFKATGWSSVGSYPTNVCNYLTAILSIFGCDFTKLNVYNVTILLCIMKIVLVIIIFRLVFKNIRVVENNELEYVISWGFILLSAFWTFSDYAQNVAHHVRYLMILLPYGTILLCLNIDRIGEMLKIAELKNKRNVTIIACCLIFALFPYGEWKVYQENIYDREYIELLQVIEEKGLHNGVWGQSFALGHNIYVMSHGKHALARGGFTDGSLVFNENPDEIYDFFVIEDNGNIGTEISSGDVYNFVMNNGYDEDVSVCDGSVRIYIFHDGIHSEEITE